MSRSAAVAILALGAAGCGVLLGVGDFQPGGAGGAAANAAVTSSAVGPGGAAGAGGSGENCLNGIDDDANGSADCADPACKAVTSCVSAPMEWSGPVYLYVGKSPPDCGKGLLAFEGSINLAAAPATCSACTCGKLDCKLSLTVFATSASCAAPGTLDALVSSQCVDLIAKTNVTSVAQESGMLVCSGTQGGAPTLTPPTFDASARVCKPPPGAVGCAVDESCVPNKSEGLAGPCITHGGDTVDCPTDFPVRTVVTEPIKDERGCSNCDCQPPAAACAGTLQLFPQKKCGGVPANVAVPSVCSEIPMQSVGSLKLDYKSNGGACQLQGKAEPTGGLLTADLTVCCRGPK